MTTRVFCGPRIEFGQLRELQSMAVRRQRINLRTAMILTATIMATSAASAGQDANFILYNQHMEEKGATEVQVFSDYSHVGEGEPNYTAQLIEIEYGVTELFTTAVYLEGVKTYEAGEEYDFGSFRWENRLRLFADETLLNPVL